MTRLEKSPGSALTTVTGVFLLILGLVLLTALVVAAAVAALKWAI